MFPSVISNFNRPTPSDRLNSPSHSALHNSVSSAVSQIETVIGLSTSSAVGTLMYDIRSPDSNGGGHVQTANKGGTGQTSYTKGDLLVASSSSVLTKLTVGANDAVLVADSAQATGVKWGSAPTANVQSFLSSGTWNKPSAAGLYSRVFVELWGAGGSGGAASLTDEAGGGGGGSYVNAWYSASTLSSSVSIGVGAGGGRKNPGQNGDPGGITVFDTVSSLLTAFGGGGGVVNSPGAGGGGGGGTAFNGSTASGTNGGGGGSILGGAGGNSNTAGQPSSYYGAIAGGGGGGGDGAAGGAAVLGGGGGGGVRASTLGAGGVSKGGGNGIAGSVIGGSGSVLAGLRPGGGGGAGYGTSVESGSGGDGLAIVTTFF